MLAHEDGHSNRICERLRWQSRAVSIDCEVSIMPAMRVWLVWTGQYSDASVVGVYSSLELAQAAAKLYTDADGWIDVKDGYEIDSNAVQVRDGVSRWQLWID